MTKHAYNIEDAKDLALKQSKKDSSKEVFVFEQLVAGKNVCFIISDTLPQKEANAFVMSYRGGVRVKP